MLSEIVNLPGVLVPQYTPLTGVHKSNNNCNTLVSWISQWTGITSNSCRNSRRQKKTAYWSTTYALQILPSVKISTNFWNGEKSIPKDIPECINQGSVREKTWYNSIFPFNSSVQQFTERKGICALTSRNLRKKTHRSCIFFRRIPGNITQWHYPATAIWLFNQYHQHWYRRLNHGSPQTSIALGTQRCTSVAWAPSFACLGDVSNGWTWRACRATQHFC